MWSGPRNISTAMMRSFENRPDCAVVDEPFYAAFLAASGADHPMRAEVLVSQPQDWRAVVEGLAGAASEGPALIYEKHMAHHMLLAFGLDWTSECRNAFLIRAPEEVLASYLAVRGEARLEDIGVVRQHELFKREADRRGRPPPVLRGADVLVDPKGMLNALCAALEIPFRTEMLAWPAGRRASDGVWAPAWYGAVEHSTGFVRPAERDATPLPDALRRIADAARPHYEALAAHRLTVSS